MYKKIVFLALLPLLASAEDFISDFEYGQMLYNEPRGVSCVPCHGDTGAGRDIASYTDKYGKKVMLSGPDIRKATLKELIYSLKKGKGIMPKYFFTDNEIERIYAYIQKVNKKSDNNATSN